MRGNMHLLLKAESVDKVRDGSRSGYGSRVVEHGVGCSCDLTRLAGKSRVRLASARLLMSISKLFSVQILLLQRDALVHDRLSFFTFIDSFV